MARETFNTKRRLRPTASSPGEVQALELLAEKARYIGNPLHKRNPGDFGLTPPASPRQGKTLCDGCVGDLATAIGLLKAGIRRGIISVQMRNGWPQNVWAVTEAGIPVEAELDNQTQGTYHGFPMPEADPFRDAVIERWNRSE
jgi:hypothetical protein